MQSILKALEAHGIGRTKIEKLVETQAKFDPKLTKSQVKMAESYLKRFGRCALYITKKGKTYFVALEVQEARRRAAGRLRQEVEQGDGRRRGRPGRRLKQVNHRRGA